MFNLLFALLFSSNLHAACTSPAGSAGYLQWLSGSSKVKYCDGTNWIDTTHATLTSCAGTTAGTINYNSGTLRYCDGTTWYSMQGSQLTSCSGTTAGSFTWDGTDYKFCDATNWYKMGPTAISFVRASTEGRTTGATSQTTSFTVLPIVGHTIIVMAVNYKSGSLSSWGTGGCTDNQSNTYTRAITKTLTDGANNYAAAIYYSSNIGSPSGTFTVTVTPSSSSQITVMALEYAGLATSSALDKTASASATTSPGTSGTTATTTQAAELAMALLDFGCGSGTCSASTPSGYTDRFTEGNSTYANAWGDEKILAATGTQSASWTLTGTGVGDSAGVIATFLGAP